MNKELSEKLFQDFPNLYRNHERCFECRDGWEPLLRNLSEQLEPIVAAMPEKSKEKWKVDCVKEKFGGLRYGYNYDHDYSEIIMDRIHALVNDAEIESFRVCDVCSSPGVLMTNKGMMKTRCDNCKDKRGY